MVRLYDSVSLLIVYEQDYTNDFEAPGLTSVIGPSHIHIVKMLRENICRQLVKRPINSRLCFSIPTLVYFMQHIRLYLKLYFHNNNS